MSGLQLLSIRPPTLVHLKTTTNIDTGMVQSVDSDTTKITKEQQYPLKLIGNGMIDMKKGMMTRIN